MNIEIDQLNKEHNLFPFIFVPTDKAQNNIAIICKKFYHDSLFKEVAFTDDKKIEMKNMSTYILQNATEKDIIKKHINDLKPFKITIPDKQLRLPFLFWIPKMHKQPSKQSTSLHLILAQPKLHLLSLPKY